MSDQMTQLLELIGSPLNLLFPPAHAHPFSFISPEVMNFAPIILVFLLMYFLILRPQSKKAKQHRDMLEALRRGDRVLTAGGIIGTVSKIENNQEIQVEIAENVRVRVAKATITQVLAKTEPLKAQSPEDDSVHTSTADETKKIPAKKSAASRKKTSKST